jgi:acyl transferase domain-containing protein/NAD(P)-dependent dehydrogenase (short-subunit alcohol dehydrogenase family)
VKIEDAKHDFSPESTPLAIIGIGCLFPKADDQSTYWANIREGIDAISEIPPTHWRTADYLDRDPKSPDMTYGERGGFLSPVPFNPMEYNIPPNILEAIDTSQLLGLVAAGHALKDAGYGPERAFDRNRTSVILGVTGALELVIPLGARLGHPAWRAALKESGVPDEVAADVLQRIADSYVNWQENSFPGLLGNVVAGRISKHFDLGGTNCVVDAACASSFSALHLAGMELATGKSDMVVTGGIDTFNSIFMYMCFSKTPALSPTGDAKPFDASGDGTILGEGLGLVVIKRLSDAERDGDRIYAVIRGVGSSSDGKGDAIYAPSASGQKNALLNAYSQAGISPATIGLLEAHGTGTRVGDAVEVSALREVFGEADAPWCCLGSVKSQIGHTKAAAGAAGLIKASLALHHKVIPPTIKVTKPLQEVTTGRTPFYLAAEKRPWLSSGKPPRRAGVSAFGFGGSNFHVVLEEYRPEMEAVDWDGNVQILAFSGADAGELQNALGAVPTGAPWNELRSAAALSRAKFDPEAPCRIALVVEREKTNLATLLANARAMLRERPQVSWNTPDGAYFAAGDRPGKLGIIFPGQGSQYTGMHRDIACAFPPMFDTLAAADEGYLSATGGRLSDLIYPHTPFSGETGEMQEKALRATAAAQPAIGAASLGLLKVLQSFGTEADAVAGHSFGELTALCAAGRLEESDFHELSRLRGRLMAEGSGDKGGMLAVSAPLGAVEELLSAEGLDLVIANRNAPNQAVLSGAKSELERAEALLSSRNIVCKRLPVAAAFHSPLVADAAAPFLGALEKIPLNTGSIPVYANTTAAQYPSDPAAARPVLANQLACPVEFVAMIEAMYGEGVRTFVEVGPGARLAGLVRAILGERDHTAIAVDASSGKRSGIADLARALAQLAAAGHDVRLSGWDEGYAPAELSGKKPAMTIPICGANYVKPKPARPPLAPLATRPQAIDRPVPVASSPKPQSETISVPRAVSREALSESLRMTRESMAMLLRMQEDTAQLHRRFLEGQETASRTFQTLLEQQQRLILGPGSHPATELPRIDQLNLPPVTSHRPPATGDQSPVTPPVSAVAANRVMETLLSVVSEKTGYPVEMLEADMALDSDLGIDSIKRVEILSAIRERLPDAPVIGPEHLGSLRTLAEIASHLGSVDQRPATSLRAEALQPAKASDHSAGEGQRPAANNHPAAVASTASVMEMLLAVVSDKTGYPVEMLEPEMSLDSDLGIDSIKRVEILSAIRERLPDAPVIGPEHLGSLRTLAEIASHLGSVDQRPATIQPAKAGDHSAGEGQRPAANNHPAASASAASVMETLLAVVSDKTGYPVEMLEADMALDSDLGIDSIKRVEILSAIRERLPDAPVIGPEHLGSLRTLAEIARHLGSAGGKPVEQHEEAPLTGSQSPASTQQVERSIVVPFPLEDPDSAVAIPLAEESEFWVTDDGSPFAAELCAAIRERGIQVRNICTAEARDAIPSGKLSGLVIASQVSGTDDLFLEKAFLLLKNAGSALRAAAATGGALFATVSRLDGAFGYGSGAEMIDPLSGALAGLAKTAAREWPEVSCKAIDLGEFPDPKAMATALAGEIFRAGPVEVGLTPAGRFALQLVETPATQLPPSPPIGKGETVVMTGGGRGVTAATAITLTAAYQPFLVLLGRSPEPTPEPAWLSHLSEEAQIKRAIIEQAEGKLHPRDIEERYRGIIAGRELRSTLSRIAAAGGKAVYRSVDIRDGAEVRKILSEIRADHGPIRGIVHGAGILADRLISDKSREQFSLVYSTKVDGLRSLLDACRDDDLRFLVLFSSITGRFGRTGQVDYAVANEAINKLARVESRLRPACRTVSINWGPWDGGMVTPALKKVFAAEGVGLIGLEAGGEFLIREISATDAPVEIVAIGGSLVKDAGAVQARRSHSLAEAFALNLTVDGYPFLRSHVLDGKAVLPMAIIVEWLAHGALHGNPGFRFHGFNDLRICKGVVFEEDTCCTLRVLAGRAEKRDTFHLVPVELTGTGPEGRSLLHARAEIVLATRLPEGIRSIIEIPETPYQPGNGELYDRERLFHGPELHGIEQVIGCSEKGIAAMVKGAPPPAAWIRQPLRSIWITDPLVIDSAFQMMILWSFERFGAGSLPCFAGRYRQFIESFPREGVQVVIRVTAEREHSALADMEFLDRHTGKLVARLEDYECVIDPSLKQAFKRNQLAQPGPVQLGAA